MSTSLADRSFVPKDHLGHTVRPDTDTMKVSLTVDLNYPMAQLPVRHWLNAQGNTPYTTFGDGHTYLVAFTAWWCGPCQRVYPAFATLPATYGQRGVRVLYVTQLFGRYGEQTKIGPMAEIDSLQHYFTEHKVTGPVAITDSTRVQIVSFPWVIVVDGAGKVRGAWGGWVDDEMSHVMATIDTALVRN